MMLPAGIEFWHWWIAAVALIAIEALVPGFFFLWLGIAAAVVGGVLLLLPDLSWEIQLLVFAVLSVASVAAWLTLRRGGPRESDHPTLNRRADAYVGRHFTLAEDMVDGHGVLTVDDSRWKIESSEDLPRGTPVRVVGVDGTTLKVERRQA